MAARRVFCTRAAMVLGAAASAMLPAVAVAAPGPRIAVAAFDFRDTSGEVRDQREAHRQRVDAFAATLRRALGAAALLPCDDPQGCSAARLGAKDLLAEARGAKADLLVYGGIHKISTLVLYGDVQMVDLNSRALRLDRVFTFRGDTDEAWRRAADFVADAVRTAERAP